HPRSMLRVSLIKSRWAISGVRHFQSSVSVYNTASETKRRNSSWIISGTLKLAPPLGGFHSSLAGASSELPRMRQETNRWRLRLGQAGTKPSLSTLQQAILNRI